MNLSGSWQFNETWNTPQGPRQDNFTATFQSDGIVLLQPAGGFGMVWFTGQQAGQEIILAGDNGQAGILAVYLGTMGANNQSMSGTSNGQMVDNGKTVAVTGTWNAVPAPVS